MSTQTTARRLTGKVALVTGGSRGIGRAIAERLGRDGALVAVAYARDEKAAAETVEHIRAGGGRAFALHAEFGRHGDAHALWPPSTSTSATTRRTEAWTSSSTTPRSAAAPTCSRSPSRTSTRSSR